MIQIQSSASASEEENEFMASLWRLVVLRAACGFLIIYRLLYSLREVFQLGCFSDCHGIDVLQWIKGGCFEFTFELENQDV